MPDEFTKFAVVPADAAHARPGHDRRQPAAVAGRVDDHRAALNRPPRWFVGDPRRRPRRCSSSCFYAWPVVDACCGRRCDARHDGSPFGHIGWDRLVHRVAGDAQHRADPGRRASLPAYVLARYSFRGRRLLTAVDDRAVRAADRGRRRRVPRPAAGVVASARLRAIIVAHVFFNIAVVVRLVGVDDRGDPTRSRRLRRARSGASPAQAARRLVVLPLLRPALWSAAAVDLPVQLHVVRRGHAARRADAPDARGRDRPPGHAARRRRWRGDALRAAA